MAYYNFTEIESYTEDSVAHKKYKVEQYSDSEIVTGKLADAPL